MTTESDKSGKPLEKNLLETQALLDELDSLLADDESLLGTGAFESTEQASETALSYINPQGRVLNL